MARSGQGSPKYVGTHWWVFGLPGHIKQLNVQAAASWLFVCNAVLMGSWAGYADSGLTLCKQVGDRPQLFAAVSLTGCMPRHPGRLGMY